MIPFYIYFLAYIIIVFIFLILNFRYGYLSFLGIKLKGNLIDSFFISNEITAMITFLYWVITTLLKLKTCEISIGPSILCLAVGYIIVGYAHKYQSSKQKEEIPKAMESGNANDKQ